ncbi:hypothetical protein DERF_006608 [Dermatophagoides farinae]|uniref:Uncharacterized protein n=1 Tax=Dermatophagoides farinae TaxID=6954 RepID=A0A922L281_DERFA|nr:hypothetical protein DERF_006608 [Dermatophagoides farinae]
MDMGHKTCIEKNSFDKEKIACFKFRIPNNSCNQQQQPKTAQTMKCETCQRCLNIFNMQIAYVLLDIQYMVISYSYLPETILPNVE